MKLVVGYVDSSTFEPIREELLELGFLSLSAWEASGSVPEPTVIASYRGASVEQHLRPKVRVECVVGGDEVQTVVDTILKHATERRFVFVLPIEAAFPVETVKASEAVVAG
jgi:nitrogen regulatory protein PII